MIIEIKSQAEFDDLPDSFKEFTFIYIKECRVIVSKRRENSSVVAWENSSVVALGNSSVEARENSSVEALGNSSVVAWGNVCARIQSDYASVVLFAFAVCYALSKGNITKKSKNCTVITPKQKSGLVGWMENDGIDDGLCVVLFKKVSKDFKTQEGTKNETTWAIGSTFDHPNWKEPDAECGPGKYHAGSRPYFCDEFRGLPGDRYIALEIAKEDLRAWPNPEYPHKISFKKAKVLYECNRLGKELKK